MEISRFFFFGAFLFLRSIVSFCFFFIFLFFYVSFRWQNVIDFFFEHVKLIRTQEILILEILVQHFNFVGIALTIINLDYIHYLSF